MGVALWLVVSWFVFVVFTNLDLVSNEKPVLKEVFFELADVPRTTGKVLGETVISILKSTTETSGFALMRILYVFLSCWVSSRS